MKIIMRILCFVIALTITTTMQAQETPKVIPPSPNAASLGIYGDIPVGHYTGVPNINIPLYEIVSGSLKVPISLSYHAAGIKVAQEASWVGLGWALNAGGVITRSIRGWDDLSSTAPIGYPHGLDLPADSNYTIDIDGNEIINARYQRYTMNEEDSEPDIFYYNFGNYSGKIMLQKGNKPLVLNQDPLKIEQFNGSCIIRTPDGNAYYFGTAEETTVYNHLLASNTRILRNIQPYVVNTWYLDSIVSPKKDKVIFNYRKNTGCIKSQISVSNTMFLAGPAANWWVHSDSYPFDEYGYTVDQASGLSASETVVDEVLLDEIIFDGGVISFASKDRTDIINNNSGGTIVPQCLDAITIRNNLSSIIGQYQFSTSYFQSTDGTTADQNRLRLDQITDLAGKKYSFTYNAENLPKKTSGSIDHWGLYNGANNELVDQYAAIPTIKYDSTAIYAGANREATLDKAKAAILTRIVYPTGGYTEFEYELNDFENSCETMGYENVSNSLNGGSSQIINLESTTGISYDFTFTKNGAGCIWVGATCDSLGRNDCNTSYLEIQKKQTDNTWATDTRYLYRNLGCFEGQSTKIRVNKTLVAGEYRLIANSFETLNAACDYRYAYHPSAVVNQGGGLRVKKVNIFDGENITSKTYDYTMLINNAIKSSGILMSKPQYHFTVTSQTCGTLGMIDGSTCDLRLDDAIGGYTKATSETIIPMGTSAQGNPVGYSQVTEIQQTADSNGKTIYYFSNNPEYSPLLFSSYPSSLLTFPGIPNLVDNSNGNLLKKEYWNSQNQLLKGEMYEYTRADSVYNVKGVKLYSLGSIAFNERPNGITTPAKDNYLIRFYGNISERWNLIKDSTITYDHSVSPVAELKQVNRYYYDNYTHTLLSRKITKNSKGNNIITINKYPSDISNGIYPTMVEKNMIDYVVEKVNLVDNSFTSGKLSPFRLDEGNYVPDMIYSLETTTPFTSFNYFNGTTKDSHYSSTPEITFDDYDTKGNLLQTTGRNGIVTSYLWDATGRYPIAEVKGATYSQISNQNGHVANYSSLTLYNSLNSLVPSAHILTYSYTPLVGMTSQTDPNGKTTYYEYDSFGRLKFIKDNDGKILKKFDYHYKN